MQKGSVRMVVPLLARLILGEMAERRGKTDEQLLVELIRREALMELRDEGKVESGTLTS